MTDKLLTNCNGPWLRHRDTQYFGIPGIVRLVGFTFILFPLTPALSLGEREKLRPRKKIQKRFVATSTGHRLTLSLGERGGVRGKAMSSGPGATVKVSMLDSTTEGEEPLRHRKVTFGCFAGARQRFNFLAGTR
jgi:hypothetical protein